MNYRIKFSEYLFSNIIMSNNATIHQLDDGSVLVTSCNDIIALIEFGKILISYKTILIR